MSGPPFTNLTAYATCVAEKVPDTKAGRTDADLVAEALERYAEDYPCWEQTDIGDGSTTAWSLAASPFLYVSATGAGFLFGFSDLWPVRVELLASAATSANPPAFLVEGRDWWIEERTASGAPVKYLVFASAPAASLARVHWRKRWLVDNAGTPNNRVPIHHQYAVVDLACALKCETLAAKYANSVDSVGGTDVFSASNKVEEYKSLAGSFWRAYKRTLGIGASSRLTRGRINTGVGRVFGAWRGVP